jgi:hypothetical protein
MPQRCTQCNCFYPPGLRCYCLRKRSRTPPASRGRATPATSPCHGVDREHDALQGLVAASDVVFRELPDDGSHDDGQLDEVVLAMRPSSSPAPDSDLDEPFPAPDNNIDEPSPAPDSDLDVQSSAPDSDLDVQSSAPDSDLDYGEPMKTQCADVRVCRREFGLDMRYTL